MTNSPSTYRAHLALLGTNIFFAINFSAVKYLFREGLVLPFGLNWVRMLVTTLLLWGLWLFRPRREVIDRRDALRMTGCALTGITINQLLFIKGLSMTHSVHASLLMLTTPLFIMLIAAGVLREPLTSRKGLGLLMGILGAAVLIGAGKNTGLAEDVVTGDLLVIINAISYSVYFILVKPLMSRYSPVTVIRMVFTIGTVMALPFCWSEFTRIPWALYRPEDLLVLAQVVIGGTFLAYLFNIYGIRQLGASVSGAYIYTQPVFATLIAVWFMNESLDLYKIAAAACIFAGVSLTHRKTES